MKFNLDYLSSPPRQRSETTKPPLLMMFHGYGSHMHDLFGLAPILDDRVHYVSAQAPFDLAPLGMPGGRAWFNIHFTNHGITYDREGAAATVTTLAEKIPALCRDLDCDPNQIYLLGFSQGAMMAHAILLKNTLPIRGIAGLSGRMVDDIFNAVTHVDFLTDIPVFVSHGLYDSVLPIENGREIVRFYQETPAALTANEYAMGHEINERCLADLRHWLTSALEP